MIFRIPSSLKKVGYCRTLKINLNAIGENRKIMLKYFKRKRDEKMWRELKKFENSSLYCFAVGQWKSNRPLRKLKRFIWRTINRIRKCR